MSPQFLFTSSVPISYCVVQRCQSSHGDKNRVAMMVDWQKVFISCSFIAIPLFRKVKEIEVSSISG